MCIAQGIAAECNARCRVGKETGGVERPCIRRIPMGSQRFCTGAQSARMTRLKGDPCRCERSKAAGA